MEVSTRVPPMPAAPPAPPGADGDTRQHRADDRRADDRRVGLEAHADVGGEQSRSEDLEHQDSTDVPTTSAMAGQLGNGK